MRVVGMGLLFVGLLVAVVGGLGAGDQGGALVALVAGGFMFVAGAVFAAAAGTQDAIGRKG